MDRLTGPPCVTAESQLCWDWEGPRVGQKSDLPPPAAQGPGPWGRVECVPEQRGLLAQPRPKAPRHPAGLITPKVLKGPFRGSEATVRRT